MDFNDVKTEELIEIYKKVNEFLKFLEKEQQDIKSHPKGWLFLDLGRCRNYLLQQNHITTFKTQVKWIFMLPYLPYTVTFKQ